MFNGLDIIHLTGQRKREPIRGYIDWNIFVARTAQNCLWLRFKLAQELSYYLEKESKLTETLQRWKLRLQSAPSSTDIGVCSTLAVTRKKTTRCDIARIRQIALWLCNMHLHFHIVKGLERWLDWKRSLRESENIGNRRIGKVVDQTIQIFEFKSKEKSGRRKIRIQIRVLMEVMPNISDLGWTLMWSIPITGTFRTQ